MRPVGAYRAVPTLLRILAASPATTAEAAEIRNDRTGRCGVNGLIAVGYPNTELAGAVLDKLADMQHVYVEDETVAPELERV